MHDYLGFSKFSTKRRFRDLHAVFLWVFFSSLMLKEIGQENIYRFLLSRRDLVVKQRTLYQVKMGYCERPLVRSTRGKGKHSLLLDQWSFLGNCPPTHPPPRP